MTCNNGLGVGAGVGGMEEALDPPCSARTLKRPAANWSGLTLLKPKLEAADNPLLLLIVAVLGVWEGVAGGTPLPRAEGERKELVELVRLRTCLPLGSILTSWRTFFLDSSRTKSHNFHVH